MSSSSSIAKASIQHARAILDTRFSRKACETDAALLANRVQHLKDSVLAAERRAEEADKKKRQILECKKDANEKKEAREKVKDAMVAVKKKEIQEVGLYGTWIPGGGDHQKKPEVNDISSQDIKKAISAREALIIKENKRKIEEIKKKHEEMLKAKKAAEERRVAKLQEAYERKMAMEERLKAKAQEALDKLEAEEARLIEVLKRQQDAEREAYDQLREVIVSGATAEE